MTETIKIGGELESVATGNKVADVANIKDKTKGNKTQFQINAEVEEAIGADNIPGSIKGRIKENETALAENGSVDQRIAEEGAKHYLKTETYNKTELNSMITTPNQGYVTVTATDQTTDVTDVLPPTGSADKVYRVGNWDGTQYDETVYSEYAWNGTGYIFLSKKSQIDEVFDISAYHANTPYADLTAALGANGANVPQSLRKGGMSVKFIQGSAPSSDNNYIQARLISDTFTTDTSKWQMIQDKALYKNINIITSGGVYNALDKISEIQKEIVSSDYDIIEVKDNNDNNIIEITQNGVNAKNLKSNSYNVLTDADREDLATKDEVNAKADKDYFADIVSKEEIKANEQKDDCLVLATDENDEVTEIYANTSNDESEELIFSDDSGAEEYAKINEDGIFGKNLKYSKNGVTKNVGDEIEALTSEASDYVGTDAIYERDYIKTNYKKDNVPYYLANPTEQTSYDEDNYLEQKIKDVPVGGKKFIFVTDTHWDSNQKHSNYLINYVKKRLGIKKVIFGGDAINSHMTNPDAEHGAYAKYLALHELTNYGNEFFACFGNDAIWCEGNHDANYVGFLNALNDGVSFDNYYQYLIDDTEVFKRTIANIKLAHFDTIALDAIDGLPYSLDIKNNLKAFAKMTYYVDDVNDKIRYIVYDTGVNGIAQIIYTGTNYGSSIYLFYDTLVRFITSCPADYDIVIVGHMLIWPDASNNISPILSAFKVGAESVRMENWNWKSVNDVQIYFTKSDLDLLESSPSVGDQAYIKNGTSYLLYECLTQGMWTQTNSTLRGISDSYQSLINLIPSPNVGDFAFVKTGEPYTYTKYECSTVGTWSITSDIITRSSNIIAYGHNSPIVSALLPEYISGSGFYYISIPRKFNGRIFTLSGHWHVDNVFISQSNSDIQEGGEISVRDYTYDSSYESPNLRNNDAILEILTDTDSFNLVVDGAYGSSNPKERNTIIEQCFDVVTITDDNHVVCTRFGTGYDRDYVI